MIRIHVLPKGGMTSETPTLDHQIVRATQDNSWSEFLFDVKTSERDSAHP